MTGGARITALAMGGLLLLLGAGLMLAWPHAPGVPPMLLGAVIIGSVLFEGRYRRGDDVPLGAGWTPTPEVFKDDETGRWLRVWQHRRSGARRYLPCEEGPLEG